ncbi:tryptophan synthase beta subunit-like PLP-dependent enzyme, partial [Atractiella rhizophila]
MQGNASMVREIKEQLGKVGLKPDGILLSAGGGGLLGGVLMGLEEVGWGHVPVAAVETSGAASLHASLLASYADHNAPTPQLVSLEAITSIAGSLGAKTVSKECIRRCLTYKGGVTSVVIEDARVVDMIERFADDHQILIEPAVAALAPFYADMAPELLKKIFKDLPRDRAPVFVVIVCGGNQVSMAKLMEWKRQFEDV